MAEDDELTQLRRQIAAYEQDYTEVSAEVGRIDAALEEQHVTYQLGHERLRTEFNQVMKRMHGLAQHLVKVRHTADEIAEKRGLPEGGTP